MKVIALIAFVFVFGAFGFGWWMPNALAWKNCGAPSSFALTRGIWERPDVLTCAGLMLQDEQGSTPAGGWTPPPAVVQPDGA